VSFFTLPKQTVVHAGQRDDPAALEVQDRICSERAKKGGIQGRELPEVGEVEIGDCFCPVRPDMVVSKYILTYVK
jgi:hypothetical protein